MYNRKATKVGTKTFFIRETVLHEIIQLGYVN